jgi:hypothetical protein
MKKSFFTFIALLVLTNAFAQKMELRISFNSGLFSLSGKSAEQNTFINYNNSFTSSSYTNNPYGSRNGLCYGLSGNLKRITNNNVVLGLDLRANALKYLRYFP